jgi:hypothetical protein
MQGPGFKPISNTEERERENKEEEMGVYIFYFKG